MTFFRRVFIEALFVGLACGCNNSPEAATSADGGPSSDASVVQTDAATFDVGLDTDASASEVDADAMAPDSSSIPVPPVTLAQERFIGANTIT